MENPSDFYVDPKLLPEVLFVFPFAEQYEKSSRRYADCFLCDPGEARTLDPMIKSHLLYQLSYGVIVFV